MKGVSAIGLFCEDIREEKSGQDTLIGILPDNMNVPSFPSVAPKLGVYVRVSLAVQKPPKELIVNFNTPWGDTYGMGVADANLIATSISQATANNLPSGGIVFKVLLIPFAMKSNGVATVTIAVDGKKQVCGQLNLLEATKIISANALPPPS